MRIASRRAANALAIAGLALVASATAKNYKPPSGAPTATLALSVKNTPAQGTTIRNAGMLTYTPAPGCAGQATLDITRLREDAAVSGKPHAIAAGAPFGLTVFYMDARRASTRRCAVSLEFTPVAGAAYVGEFEIDDEIDSCKVSLRRIDGDGAAPAATIRPQVCLQDNPTLLTSGRGLRVDLDIDVKLVH